MKRKNKLGEEHVPALLGTLGVSIIFNVRFPNKSGWVTKCIESGCIYQHHPMQFFPAASCQQTSPTVLVWIRVACELAKRCSSGDFEQHEAELHHGTLKLEFVPNFRRGIYPFRSHKRILSKYRDETSPPDFSSCEESPTIKQLNVRNIKTRWNSTTVQEVSSTRDISLHFCLAFFAYMQRNFITYICQTAYSYHFISVYISDCMCTTTHLYWPLHRSHTYHALESLAIGGAGATFRWTGCQGPQKMKVRVEAWSISNVGWVKRQREPKCKKKPALQCGKAGKKGAKKTLPPL